MLDHMDEQSHEPIDKVLPCLWFLRQTAVEQIAIDFGERHGTNVSDAGQSESPVERGPIKRWRSPTAAGFSPNLFSVVETAAAFAVGSAAAGSLDQEETARGEHHPRVLIDRRKEQDSLH